MNFPFIHEDKELWYSRSVAVGLYVFGKNRKGEWHVLMNKRGVGCPSNHHKWNAPCGYLDFDETLQLAAVRECMEETGVITDPDDLKLCRVDSIPVGEKQNVTISFYTVLPQPIENYKLTSQHSEKNEVEGIRFINIGDLNTQENLSFAFQHNKIAKMIFENFVKPKNIIQKFRVRAYERIIKKIFEKKL